MPRPAPPLAPFAFRLSPDAYPHSAPVQTRFQDLDVLGHINNVAFAALFETGRTRSNREVKLWGREVNGRRAVVARVEIKYLAEGHFPDDVEIATGIGEVGNRSWQILATMFQSGAPIATCDVTIVMDKGADGNGLSDAYKAELAKWLVRER